LMATLERMGMLQVIDERWKEHLREMDDLKEGINLRAYGQKDPLLEYKAEAFQMFTEMLDMINREVVGIVFKVFPAAPEQIPARRPVRVPRPQELTLTHSESLGMGFQANRAPVGTVSSPAEAKPGKPQPVRVGVKVGRNDPCPCGSGKKYKNCHGK
jgi:preprotein translocase subunit SecA